LNTLPTVISRIVLVIHFPEAGYSKTTVKTGAYIFLLQKARLTGALHVPLRTNGAVVEDFRRRQVPRSLETGPSDQQSSQAPVSAFFTQ
jgi:hypothetical protein